MPWKRKPPPTGLDCGQSWAKAVCLRRSRQGVELERMGRVPVPKSERDPSDKLAATLEKLQTSMQWPSQVVTTSLAGHSVIIKWITLTQRQSAELPDSLPSLAAQHIPFDVQDVCLDYQILGPSEDQQDTTVLLVASKKKMISQRQAVMAQAGIDTRIIDVDGFALCNCFEFNYPEPRETPVALLDIGAQQSTLCVVHHHFPLFVRDAGFGGQQITDRLMQALDLPASEAETLKWQDPESLEAGIRGRVEREVHATFVAWSEEIQRLLHYYANSQTSGVSSPATLFISGGGSLHPGLQAVLDEHLDFEVDYLDPWRHCRIDDARFDPGYVQSIGPQFAVATGLALRGIMDS